MNKDRGFAGLILIAAAVYGIIWYYRRKNAFQGTTVNSLIGPVAVGSTPLARLENFAKNEGVNITPNPTGLRPNGTYGGHVAHSLHYAGRAVDIPTRSLSPSLIQQIISDAKGQGIQVIDEREQPAGETQWTGPHIHLQIPY